MQRLEHQLNLTTIMLSGDVSLFENDSRYYWATGSTTTEIIDFPGYLGVVQNGSPSDRAGGLDAVHAEDMSIVKIKDGEYRMYYAACDKNGKWRIASAGSDR